MSEKAICEGCEKTRVVRRIDSGQLICNACYREIKPPRPPKLTSWDILDEFAGHGIKLNLDATHEQSIKLYSGRGMLEYVIRDVSYNQK